MSLMSERVAERARQCIDGLAWREAKSWAKTAPHQYTVRQKDDAGLEVLYCNLHGLIEEHGEDRQWGRRTYRYLHVDGFRYWHMGPLYQSRIINRARLEDP